MNETETCAELVASAEGVARVCGRTVVEGGACKAHTSAPSAEEQAEAYRVLARAAKVNEDAIAATIYKNKADELDPEKPQWPEEIPALVNAWCDSLDYLCMRSNHDGGWMIGGDDTRIVRDLDVKSVTPLAPCVPGEQLVIDFPKGSDGERLEAAYIERVADVIEREDWRVLPPQVLRSVARAVREWEDAQ